MRRTAAAWLHDVEAEDRGRPPSGSDQVERIRTAVVLPAPLGPEDAEDGAGRRPKLSAVEGAHLALGEDLVRSRTSMAGPSDTARDYGRPVGST